MHDLTVIVTLTGGLAVALVLGWITQRIGLSTLVGYMLAGIAVGPYTPGFVADARLAQQMAEIGVILLMFGVGMHFHPQELLRVRRVAIPGAVVQSLVAGVAGWALARAFGWSDVAGIVFGMALAVASTVVLMRMLVQNDRLASHDGHVAVGWLIVEDIFTVIALVVMPALVVGGGPAETAGEVAIAIGKAGVFALLVWALGTRLLTPGMEWIAKIRSSELFTLTVFVVALGVALFASEVFHISVALGAFFAGLVVGQSRIGPQAAADMAPFRDVFSALFFVSIGMLFNPAVVLERPEMLALALGIVLVLKPLAALAIVLLLRDTARTALTVAVGLAQIGEFSFILAAQGVATGALPREGYDVLVAAAILSIALNPLLFKALPALERRFSRSEDGKGADEAAGAPAEAAPAPSQPPAEACPVVITGAGKVGRGLAQRAHDRGVPVCVVDDRLEALESLRAQGLATVFGDPSREAVLEAASTAGARVIVVTNSTLAMKVRICAAARRLNPRIAVVAPAENEAERAWLREFGAAYVAEVHDEVAESLVRAVRRAL
jgi:CPA2 family monovalent cation:H+ antiporter-2